MSRSLEISLGGQIGHHGGLLRVAERAVASTTIMIGERSGDQVLTGGGFNSAAINFAAKQGNASGAAGLSPEGALTVYLVPGEDDVGVRDDGGQDDGAQRNLAPPAYYPVVIPARYNSADTIGTSVTAAADSKPVTIAIEKQ